MAINFLLPSLVLWGLGLFLIRFYPGVKAGAYTILFVAVVVLVLHIFYVICDHFSGNGINDAAVFHVLYAIDLNVIAQFWPFLFVVPSLGLLLYLIWRFYDRRWSFSADYFFPSGTRAFRGFMAGFGWVAVVFSLVIHPAVSDGHRMVQQLYINKGARNLSSLMIMDVQENPSNKTRSFIYIYAESLEESFFDEKLYPGLLPELNKLRREALTIKGIGQAPMTEWTIAGMTASQCGIPLATFSSGRNEMGKMDHFLPGITCVGDVLGYNGYHLTYIGGADIGFAGKNNFYASHGFADVKGYREIESSYGKVFPKSKWGIYDDDLLDIFWEEFQRIAVIDKPFGFVGLTLDTHSPLGHETPICKSRAYNQGESKILNSVHCADYLLSDFIKKFLDSPLSEDVVLIVSSDHLMMRNDAGLSSESQQRNNSFMVFNSEHSGQVIIRNATMLDVAPTLLALVGYDVAGFSLGRNLLSSEPTLAELYGRDVFYEQLIAWRSSLWDYWD